MKIAVLGTGTVGRALAGRISSLGHDVVVGTRDPKATLARTEPDRMGNPPFASWLADHPKVKLLPFAEAAAHGDLIVNATSGNVSLAALGEAGEENLNGKVLLDASNPLDLSGGFPPTMFVKDTDSLGEQVQRAFPAARVVKSLNTVPAPLMVDPAQLAGGEHSIFVGGEDPEAKATVTELLRSFGWRDVVDLGDITSARATEMLAMVWLRLWTVLGTMGVNVRVVR
jgi:8-hydroxy-5-deazaflavin:NADPH oxidoreductase